MTAIACLLLFAPACTLVPDGASHVPAGFVNLAEYLPGIRLEVRYAGSDNFIGAPVDGYRAPKVYLSRRAAAALAAVQAELEGRGLGLKVFDGYRPQRAVDHFVRWARDTDATAMKQRYYPNVDKRHLFRDGYIAQRSGHSRGSAVDLTLIDLQTGLELDMGSGWDFFDLRSWPESREVSPAQRTNRLLLRSLMTKHGFQPLEQEWWHFSLADEPWPDTWFDFPIE